MNTSSSSPNTSSSSPNTFPSTLPHALPSTFPHAFPKQLFLIAGPCMLEDEEMAFKVAKHMQSLCKKLCIPYVFKASFDKANRSSVNTMRGPGLKKGLAILAKIKKELSLAITSDVHTPHMVEECGEVLDILQIPAFLARQTDLYIEAAKTKKLLNVKKGQFMAPEEMRFAIEKFRQSGGKHIALTERGTFFGYGNLVVDFRSLSIMQSMGVPVIYDATHSVQRPAARGGSSGGDRAHLQTLLRAALITGVDGVFIETHPKPSNALSDKETQVPLEDMTELCNEMVKLRRFASSLKKIN